MSFFLRLLGCAAVFAALLMPADASAAKGSAAAKRAAARSAAAKVKTPTPIELAVYLGAVYWGAAPCNAEVELLTRQRPGPGVDRTSDAWVTFGTPIGDNNLAASASTYTDCTISLSRSRWPTRASMIEDWDVLCMTVTHEVGHLLGRAHDDEPSSIMAPRFSDYSAEPEICRTSRPRSV